MTPVSLRPLEVSDLVDLAALANNRNIWDNVRDYFPSPYTESDARNFIEGCRHEDPFHTFAVLYEGAFCGVTGLIPGKDVNRISAEIGYWIGEPFWGKGIGTTAVSLLVDYGFRELGFTRIFAAVFDFNLASMKVLKKAGFYKEGVFRKSVIKNGKVCDDHRFAILNPDQTKSPELHPGLLKNQNILFRILGD